MFKNIPNRVGMVFPILFITKPGNRKEINPQYSLEGLMLKLQYLM